MIALILKKWSRIHVRLAPLSSALLGEENSLTLMGDKDVCDGPTHIILGHPILFLFFEFIKEKKIYFWIEVFCSLKY